MVDDNYLDRSLGTATSKTASNNLTNNQPTTTTPPLPQVESMHFRNMVNKKDSKSGLENSTSQQH